MSHLSRNSFRVKLANAVSRPLAFGIKATSGFLRAAVLAAGRIEQALPRGSLEIDRPPFAEKKDLIVRSITAVAQPLLCFYGDGCALPDICHSTRTAFRGRLQAANGTARCRYHRGVAIWIFSAAAKRI